PCQTVVVRAFAFLSLLSRCSSLAEQVVTARLMRFSFTAPSTAGFYPLSLHDALPISRSAGSSSASRSGHRPGLPAVPGPPAPSRDRKSTRLNSSHEWISYAVFCLKKNEEHTLYVPDPHVASAIGSLKRYRSARYGPTY